jgi:hypothetical protein
MRVSSFRTAASWAISSTLALGAFLALTAAATGLSTGQARTAAPAAVNLSGSAAAEGSSTSFVKSDHGHPITGTLPAANGGTGQSSYTIGDLLYASGATALSKLAAGTANYVLTSGGAGVAPSWAAASGGVPSGGTLGQVVTNTAAGAGGWDWAIPNPAMGRRTIYWQINDPGTAGFVIVGNTGTAPSHGGTGTQTLGTLAGRPSLYEAVPGGVGAHGQLFTTAQFTRPGYRPRARGYFRSPASLATRRWSFTIESGGVDVLVPRTSGSAASGITFVGVFYNSSVSGNFLVNTGDGANFSGTDTGLAVPTNTDFWVDLDWTTAGTFTARIYLTALTNAPTTTSTSSNLSTGTTLLYGSMDDANLAVGAMSGFERTAFLWDTN